MTSLAVTPPAIMVPDRKKFTIAQLSALSGYSPWTLRVMWRNRLFKATVIQTERRTTLLVPRDEVERLVRELQPRYATDAECAADDAQD